MKNCAFTVQGTSLIGGLGMGDTARRELKHLSFSSPRTLGISFDRWLPENEPLADLSRLINPHQHWNYLQSLSLDNMRADYELLISVLSTHSSTLRSLEFSDICLTGTHPCPGNPLSWIEFFMWLNENMSLTSFKITEWLETQGAGGDGWLVNCSHDQAKPKGCLVRRIEKYVTNQGVFPFMRPGEGDLPNILYGRPCPWTRPGDDCWKPGPNANLTY